MVLSRVARLLFGLGVALAVGGLLALLYLTFLGHLPEHPDAATGYVVQFDVPSGTYFINRRQAWLAERMPFIGICIGLLGVIVRRVSESRARRHVGSAAR